jgi:hypothetical protein
MIPPSIQSDGERQLARSTRPQPAATGKVGTARHTMRRQPGATRLRPWIISPFHLSVSEIGDRAGPILAFDGYPYLAIGVTRQLVHFSVLPANLLA